LELSTITAGQAKWTARWQTRIPGQRTIEAWTRLHIVLAGQREGIHLVLPLRDRSWTQERPLQRSTLLESERHVHHWNLAASWLAASTVHDDAEIVVEHVTR